MLNCTALCAIGAEKILGNELKHLGYSLRGSSSAGRVKFAAADAKDVYRSNLCLRTADRVFIEAASYPAGDFDALYRGAYAAPWQDFFKKNTRLVIDKVRCDKSRLSSEHGVQSVVHKAVAQKLCDSWRLTSLPESGNTCAVRVYIERDEAELVLDTSGEPLYKRGYRAFGLEAPLRETLAATLLQAAGWRRKLPLHDPFCGAGTIVCEAMLYAYNAPPGFGRRFAIEELPFFNPSDAERVRRDEAEKIRTDCLVRITGSDIDAAASGVARANVERACAVVERALSFAEKSAKLPRPVFTQSDFALLRAPFSEGLLLANPPYGERLGNPAEAEELYGRMGCLFEAFPGWKMGFITPRENFEKLIAHEARSKRKLKSGKLDTVFYLF
jgi:putative N6-adenine-specific DNA methylase